MTLRMMRPTLLYSKNLDSEGEFSPSQDSNLDDKEKKIPVETNAKPDKNERAKSPS